MRIADLLTEERVDRVKAKMAFTIDPAHVRVPVTNGYTNVSCFGKVSHYLRNNQTDPEALILLFGFADNKEVTHVCLFDQNKQTMLVDTFEGNIVKRDDGKVVYRDKNNDDHELIQSISVRNFMREMFVD